MDHHAETKLSRLDDPLLTMLDEFCIIAHKNITKYPYIDLIKNKKREAIATRDKLYEIKKQVSEDVLNYEFYSYTRLNSSNRHYCYQIYYHEALFANIEHIYLSSGFSDFHVQLKTYNVCPLKHLCKMSIITNNISTQSLPRVLKKEIDNLQLEFKIQLDTVLCLERHTSNITTEIIIRKRKRLSRDDS